MSRVLILTIRMRLGYGVDLVVHEVCRRWVRGGHRVDVVCTVSDSTFSGPYEITELREPTVERVLAFAEAWKPDVILACTSPFFEMLPVLRHRFCCWAWEFGDPTPEFFPDDGASRQQIATNKTEFCYPVIHGTVAISSFVRQDIGWPGTEVVHLGCDHAPDLGSKGLHDFAASLDEPLRIGTLMRLGKGEARYKGNDLFLELFDRLGSLDGDFEFSVMGKGTPQDARPFEEAGMRVFVNASDEEKWRFLRGLDVFVSCSLWEGFNLPLVEAQALGTLSLAFDVGSHPEVCPMLFSSVGEMAEFLARVGEDRGLLQRHSRAAYRFVRSSFLWDRTAGAMEDLVLRAPGSLPRAEPGADRIPPARRGLLSTAADSVVSALRSLRYEGTRATLAKLRRRSTWRPTPRRTR